jgi:ABC-type ATPase with predicted acetyltransferase domain
LKNVHGSQKFYEWKTRTKQTLAHIYGENHSCYLALEDIHGFHYSERTISAVNEASELLNGLIENLQNFGFPKINLSSNSGVNVNVNQNSNQNQSTNVSIHLDFLVEILKDELKGGQVKELKAIIESDDEPEIKKKSFIDKIKSFGSDVSSNILASLLTNPQVYEKLAGML